jgi:activator of HSP90 ATPase
MSSAEKPERTSTRRRMITGLSAGAVAMGAADAQSEAGEEIIRTMESIHQEVTFKASPQRVYTALIDARQFHEVTLLSAAIKSGMVKTTQATEISREAGGTFALFGGHVVGRQIELVPNERIVQAWRPVDWEPGVYSIARVDLSKQGPGTRLVFTHSGFPKGQGEHLAQGWKANYWQPLEQFLS